MDSAVYPGSFDPITYGHVDVILRAASVFDRVIVAVLANPRKAPLLGVGERVAVIRDAVASAAEPGAAARIEVREFDGLTVDLCRSLGARFIVRGLRFISDFENEIQLAHNNRRLDPDVDTVFFMTSVEQGYISSSLAKEIARFGGDVRGMLPEAARLATLRALGVTGPDEAAADAIVGAGAADSSRPTPGSGGMR
jgi:pantetheine-phosphate adenylyltransferase